MQVFVVAVAVSPNAHAMPCNAMRGEARGAMTRKMRDMWDMCDTSEENATGTTNIFTKLISICRHEGRGSRLWGLLPMTWRNGSLGKNAYRYSQTGTISWADI